MGGHGLIRIARPMAFAGAVATLLAALFVCVAPHGGAGAGHRGPVAGSTAAGHPASGYGTGHEAGEYICPYDRGDCGLFPYLTPAVLTAPPLDPPAQPDGLVRAGATAPAGRPAASGVRPRAPDLHVLQVLRT
ncbi:hypothetical protein ACF068_25510 [Streptomyces sp. NPDC016309]|uniref:hypothetical protein n=1 Tax=Streptomyces sp. NPDC016309 TaxID=3364965 RepID=UPI0036FD998F